MSVPPSMSSEVRATPPALVAIAPVTVIPVAVVASLTALLWYKEAAPSASNLA